MGSIVTERQQEIINAARKIIVSKGAKNLTVRHIANELDITDGALYRHFKSKKDIIRLLIDDIEETLLTTIKKAAGSSADPLKKLENVFFSHASYAEQRRGATFVIINETLSIRDRGLQKKMYGVIDKYLETIKDILSEGIKSGKFRKDINTDSASIIFFGMVQSAVILWALSGFGRSFFGRDNLSQMLNIYKKGIGR